MHLPPFAQRLMKCWIPCVYRAEHGRMAMSLAEKDKELATTVDALQAGA
jgi:hypothetical protein